MILIEQACVAFLFFGMSTVNTIFIYRPQGKVMFSEVSVCSVEPPPRGRPEAVGQTHPLGRHPRSRQIPQY